MPCLIDQNETREQNNQLAILDQSSKPNLLKIQSLYSFPSPTRQQLNKHKVKALEETANSLPCVYLHWQIKTNRHLQTTREYIIN